MLFEVMISSTTLSHEVFMIYEVLDFLSNTHTNTAPRTTFSAEHVYECVYR